jgi:hypothetical protein
MRFLMLTLAAVALVGCSDHPVDQFVAVGDSINAEVCSCPAFETEDFCTMPDELSNAEVSCLKRVYDDYEGELSGTVDCFIDAGQELNSCARAADCDLADLDICNDVYEARVDGCPDTTEVAGEAFDACIID